DLYQAATAPKPCAAFRETLDHIAKSKDVYFVEHVLNPKLEPPAANGADKDDLAICGELPAKLMVVRDLLATAYPDEAAKFRKSPKAVGGTKKQQRYCVGAGERVAVSGRAARPARAAVFV